MHLLPDDPRTFTYWHTVRELLGCTAEHKLLVRLAGPWGRV